VAHRWQRAARASDPSGISLNLTLFQQRSCLPLIGIRNLIAHQDLVGLYDNQGVLRFVGRDHADCLAYAELFDLDLLSCSITALGALAGRPPRFS
jgi:hypothetical protein